MLSNLEEVLLGSGLSHGEGKFHLPMPESNYNIVAKYGYEGYPANPNGSDYNTAMLCDQTGRHLRRCHISNAPFSVELGQLSIGKEGRSVPWLAVAFVNARKWLEAHPKG